MLFGCFRYRATFTMSDETSHPPDHQIDRVHGADPHDGVRADEAVADEAVADEAVADAAVAAYCRRVREVVSQDRFEHIRRVMETSVDIAKGNGLPESEVAKVALAAILHDAARDLPDAELLRLAPPTCELEAAHPLTLHGRAGRRLAEAWGVTDATVLRAVEGHVFGVPPGQVVGMCVYVADVCEPGRGVNGELRDLAMHDLKAAYRRAVEAKVEYLKATGKPIHPVTLGIYRSLQAAEGA